MRLSIATVASLAIGCSVMAAPLSDERIPMLSDTSVLSENIALDKRLSIEEQVAILGAGAMGLLNVNAAATYISNLIKQTSDMNSCGVISGSVDGVNYQYHAATSGKKCDTTAEIKTIKDAIERALDFMTKGSYNQACFSLSHGGTWRGLLQLAGKGIDIKNDVCEGLTYLIHV
ncbi:hypothetical protein HBH56_226420 [Parastagonospora nodorum]|uniref:Secreted protein CSS2 C-terminal domain-containing protein n=1 Tax=Phaeosphaeria nodorum (strain SN15 / ATCC MYA-4574 / FGSC 10173) TaxID=321614 RepID=A0A7U2FCJ4_PHANO|nr:hypothetical protein HBH56_226420 [Parastagonospora nodorum]QRD01794.1 hypothetical protein JI435_047790 [Parastagonospora nodorum SN15]KAH3935360.1 hypothetical protein HBH54_032300 [Parastagonospora nodorum]KAH3939996.1 hypothetical protein HBH53_224460 [Parastagonospora nodorum]KAH4013026.1 hypothetical protein HBI09_218430 [Parastagonospora nodorum]